jgi:predicted TIM-barrel fold metal-dependent hydrolase
MTTETIETRKTSNRVETAVIDGDIHNAAPSDEVLVEYIPAAWQKHYLTVGRRGYTGSGYARAVPHAARLDAWPTSGLPPGGDLDFMRQQLLDEWDLEYGILNCLYGIGSESNQDFGAALTQAMNDWQVAAWIDPEPRLKASLLLPYESADLAVAEIERIGDHAGFVQILLCVVRVNPWDIENTGPSMKPPPGINWLLASISVARAAGPSQVPAGPRTTSKTMVECPRLSRPR